MTGDALTVIGMIISGLLLGVVLAELVHQLRR